MSININNLTKFYDYLKNYTDHLQQKKQSEDVRISDLQSIRKFFEEHKSFIGESDVDGTALFLKLVKQLKDLTKGTDEGSKEEVFLDIARKIAAHSFNHFEGDILHCAKLFTIAETPYNQENTAEAEKELLKIKDVDLRFEMVLRYAKTQGILEKILKNISIRQHEIFQKVISYLELRDQNHNFHFCSF